MPELSQDFRGVRFKARTIEAAVKLIDSAANRAAQDWWDNFHATHEPNGYPAPSADQRPGESAGASISFARIATDDGRSRTFEDVDGYLAALRRPYKSTSASIFSRHPLTPGYQFGLAYSDYGGGSVNVTASAPTEVEAEKILAVFIDSTEAERGAVSVRTPGPGDTPTSALPMPRPPSTFKRTWTKIAPHLLTVVVALLAAVAGSVATVIVTTALSGGEPTPTVTITFTPPSEP